MNIIVMRDGYARPLTVSAQRLAAWAALLFAAPILFGSLLFWFHAWHMHRLRAGQQNAAVAHEMHVVQKLRLNSQRTIAGLAREVGALTAETSRLDAMALQAGQLAGLPLTRSPCARLCRRLRVSMRHMPAGASRLPRSTHSSEP